MGCGGSKVDDLRAVSLCRDRSRLLADAIRARRALAEAHAAHARSLRSVGSALRRFLDARGAAPASPVLPLPPSRKADPSPPPSPLPHHSRSRSHSGSHIHFPSSESESDYDSGSDSPLHSGGPEAEPAGPTDATLSFSRVRPALPDVAFAESSEPVRRFDGPQPTPDSNLHPYPYSYSCPDPPAYPEYGGTSGTSSSPTPSPPKSSAWDFLNLFESCNAYFAPCQYNNAAAYTPSRSSEVREEEGIPDLEEEEEEDNDVVTEADGEQHKFPDECSCKSSVCSDAESGIGKDSPCDVGPTGTVGGGGSECDAHCDVGPTGTGGGGGSDALGKDVVAGNAEQPDTHCDVVAPRKYENVSEVLDEIEAQFNRAAESADEVLCMLGVRRLVPCDTSGMHSVTPALSYEEFSDFEEDRRKDSKSLSKTLQKLYMWEKKLHKEVRVEEKMRVLYDKYCKRLKYLDQKGAEANEIDATQTMIRKLSMRIEIAIQVVDSISNRINKLRDEELWLRICELIQGLMRMWSVMLDSYQSQSQAFSKMKILDSMSSGGKLGDALMEATKLLEFEMLEWLGNFSAWINAQRSYIRVMDSWLLKCIHYEPEETPDGIAPFSPGRLDAPPVFVICKYWSEVMERISEREVVDSMQSFAANVLQFWQQRHFEQRQRVIANGDMDATLKILEKEEQQMRRTVDAQSKKLVLVSVESGLSLYREDIHRAQKVEINSLQLGLNQIFETMENFTASSVKVYEELYMRSEEERLARGNVKVP